MPPRVPFVDISEHQGTVNFAAMRSAGVEHIILRAGIGGRYDFKLSQNVAGAEAAGIKVVGLYWFINPKSSSGPEAQGALAAQACATYGVHMMMLDCEWYDSEGGPNPKLGGRDYMRWCERFAQVVRDRGFVPTVYTSAAFWNPLYVGVGSWLSELDVIVATYPHYGDGRSNQVVEGYSPDRWEWRAFTFSSNGPLTPAGYDQWDGWQFSAGFNKQGPVYGCQSGDLDLNVADVDAVKRWLGKPLDPTEDELTPEDKAWISQAIAVAIAGTIAPFQKSTKESFDALWSVLTGLPASDPQLSSMQQCVFEINDEVRFKTAFVDRIAAAVVAAMPEKPVG